MDLNKTEQIWLNLLDLSKSEWDAMDLREADRDYHKYVVLSETE